MVIDALGDDLQALADTLKRGQDPTPIIEGLQVKVPQIKVQLDAALAPLVAAVNAELGKA